MAMVEQRGKALKGNVFSRVINEIKAEVTRITWPSGEQIKKATVAVLAFTVFFAVLIGLIDLGLNNLYQLVFK